MTTKLRNFSYRSTIRTDHPHRSVLTWIILILVGIAAIGVISPFILLAMNSLRSESDYLQNGPLSWPHELSMSAWVDYIDRVSYFRVLGNSIVIAGSVAIIGVLLSLLASYALGIGKIRGNAIMTLVLLFGTMLPQEALLYPIYYGMDTLGLRNSIWSVVIVFSVLQAAYGTYLLSSIMSTFPPELLEAGAIDGASRWRILRSIVFPVVRPTLAVLLVFFFIWTWNEFLIPMILLTDPSSQTVPIALASLKGQNTLNITELNAGSLLSLLPTLIFFLIFQRTLVRGVAVGAVK